MRNLNRYNMGNLLLAGLALLLGMILIAFFFRSPVASWVVNRQIARFNKQHHTVLSIDRIRIKGLAAVQMEGMSLSPENGDTLVSVDTVFVSIGILKLFAGRLSIHQVSLVNPRLTMTDRNGMENYRFLIDHPAPKRDTMAPASGYAAMAERMLRFTFDKIPLELRISNFYASFESKGHKAELHSDQLHLSQRYFRCNVEWREDSLSQRWTVAGHIDNNRRLAEFRLFSDGCGKMELPWVKHQWGAGIAMDTLAFRFNEIPAAEGTVSTEGFLHIHGLMADHGRIACRPVIFDQLATDYRLTIGEDYVEIDSATQVVFNRIRLHPYLRYQPRPGHSVILSVHKPPFPAQDLFGSFPPGLFTVLEGITTRGELSWDLNFQADLASPDSLVFETALHRHQFGVISYGTSNLTKLNEEFIHTVWEDNQPVRSFTVGPENPDFRRLEQMSSYLQYAVMTSEDGGFYQHRGFLPDAFRESLITNIKERRFARGGSTITMQLVKNAFLNRNKTIARKLEEALIVWLIENQGLTTKERMMEVYLNIIEWGPMIYGANEAAGFYFGKDASKLTLEESIFLASVIPRPKSFRYAFDEEGRLREYQADFFMLVTQKMLDKGWISPGEAEKMAPSVELKGAARKWLKRGDSIPGNNRELLQGAGIVK